MSHVATNLVEGDPIPEGDEVARYCKPTDYDRELNQPTVLAFMKRRDENDLSVNRLQYYQGHGRAGAVDCIRCEVRTNRDLKPNGRFVVFEVAGAKVTAKKQGFDIRVSYTPKPSSPSHTSIFDLPTDYDAEVRVAAAIMRLITSNDIYPAVA